jgi:hypothetical protein
MLDLYSRIGSDQSRRDAQITPKKNFGDFHNVATAYLAPITPPVCTESYLAMEILMEPNDRNAQQDHSSVVPDMTYLRKQPYHPDATRFPRFLVCSLDPVGSDYLPSSHFLLSGLFTAILMLLESPTPARIFLGLCANPPRRPMPNTHLVGSSERQSLLR